jgi:hypothetical protein
MLESHVLVSLMTFMHHIFYTFLKKTGLIFSKSEVKKCIFTDVQTFFVRSSSLPGRKEKIVILYSQRFRFFHLLYCQSL